MDGSDKVAPIKVWETDYENYDIQYYCIQMGMFKQEMFSVSSRELEMSKENWAKVKSIIAEKLPAYNIDTSHMSLAKTK